MYVCLCVCDMCMYVCMHTLQMRVDVCVYHGVCVWRRSEDNFRSSLFEAVSLGGQHGVPQASSLRTSRDSCGSTEHLSTGAKGLEMCTNMSDFTGAEDPSSGLMLTW